MRILFLLFATTTGLLNSAPQPKAALASLFASPTSADPVLADPVEKKPIRSQVTVIAGQRRERRLSANGVSAALPRFFVRVFMRRQPIASLPCHRAASEVATRTSDLCVVGRLSCQ